MDNGLMKILMYDHGTFTEGLRPAENADTLRKAAASLNGEYGPLQLEVTIFTHIDRAYRVQNARGQSKVISSEGIRAALGDDNTRFDGLLVYEGAPDAKTVIEEGEIVLQLRDMELSRMFVIAEQPQQNNGATYIIAGDKGYLTVDAARIIAETLRRLGSASKKKAN